MKERAIMIFMSPVIKSWFAVCGFDKEIKAAKKEIKKLNKQVDYSLRLIKYEEGKSEVMGRYIASLLHDNEELIKAMKQLSSPQDK
jgi:hypothetical protein